MTGLYFTGFNFSDEQQKVLIAFAFVFCIAESCSGDFEGDRNTFSIIINTLLFFPR